MRTALYLLIFLCLSCSASKKYNRYIGQTKDYLISAEGTPGEIKTDTIGNERIIYLKKVKLHNPRYSSVTNFITFYIDSANKVSRWTKYTFKETPPTDKPKMAMD